MRPQCDGELSARGEHHSRRDTDIGVNWLTSAFAAPEYRTDGAARGLDSRFDVEE